jgi:hypothetical protein
MMKVTSPRDALVVERAMMLCILEAKMSGHPAYQMM